MGQQEESGPLLFMELMLIALLENNLCADGSVLVPKSLQPYMGGKSVLTPKH